MIYNYMFHAFDKALRGFYQNAALNAEKAKTIDGVFKGFLPVNRMLWALAFFIIFYLIPIPQDKMHDSTLWVGILSFEGAIGIGIIAAAQWLTQIVGKFLRAFILESIKAEIISWNESEYETPEKMLDDQFEKATLELDAFAVRITLNGVTLLIGAITLITLAIWLSPHSLVAILVASVIWTLGCIFSTSKFTVFAFNHTFWKFYHALKNEHNRLVEHCKECNRASDDGRHGFSQ